ncbi:homocysteine S-methyltransferase family protein [Caldinitratiruptor microaerophilus]|uniref:Methionine synthase n=1 Tax=Caldinitratiruptor microaerophilus TaxID=671077 RepID=A0AA35CP53_9FIRM|nr:homocysteine S-methyltransferase family protein [Caldinitratiruptor microaerophilus]BDG61030.1 5-methyltetrahydrofolate--homocysteine methyltransferase [Caldinitratiruptor microaerophilus]
MDFFERLRHGVVVFDGAMGTQLQARGLPAGGCPELWNLERPDVVRAIHADYVAAGAQVVETNTFGAVPLRLGHYGLADRVREINVAAVRLAREAAGDRALVAASVGPLGQLLEPLGPYPWDEAYAQYAAQARALAEARPDLIIIETIADLNEMRAAILACRDHAPGIPIIAQMTMDRTGRTFTGTDPETAVVVLQSLGAAVVGLNCSVGPDALTGLVARMARVARVPVSVQPNAGLPLLQPDGRTVFPMGPEEFAAYGPRLVEAGASIVGGCCGTTPEHIRLLATAVAGLRPPRRQDARAEVAAFASRTRSVFLLERDLPMVIGERINPTGRKKLSAELRAGRLAMVREDARAQVAAGAVMLDVNVGVPGIDEAAAMAAAVRAVQEVADVPLSIDSPGPEVLEAGLKAFVGKALVNSFSGEPERLEKVLPIARRWGAGVIGLTLDEKGIPATASQRLAVARRLVDHALAAGVPRQDIVIDVLTLTAGAQQAGAKETLRAIRLVKEELGVRTSLGLSNISFGLPNRGFLNAVYLAMALGEGLDMVITNPLDERIMDTIRAVRLFLNRDRDAREYVAVLGKKTLVHSLEEARRLLDRPTGGPAPGPALPAGTAGDGPGSAGAAAPLSGGDRPIPPVIHGPDDPHGARKQALYRGILDGDRDRVLENVEAALADGMGPMAILNEALIPAIEEVGRLFGAGIYFLPQLMLSATAMKQAFARLKPELQKERTGRAEIGTVVLATVQGDIHDIGKNIVAVLLENYGFRVIDLGRDVKNEVVVERALEEGADMVGLSALMTTTMPQMRKVIELFRQRGSDMPVLIGGAATSRRYADEIGAAGHGRDAQEAVREALRVLEAVRARRGAGAEA